MVDGMREIADENVFSEKNKKEISPLLNLFRNVCAHLLENQEWRRFGNNQAAVEFFLQRFPKLLIVTWRSVPDALRELKLDLPQDLQAFYDGFIL